jgi:hypothetical protein
MQHLGLRFLLMLEPIDLKDNPNLAEAVYRPGRIVASFQDSVNWIELSWADGKKHTATVSLKHVREHLIAG